MPTVTILLSLVVGLAAAPKGAAPAPDMSGFFPPDALGWPPAGPERAYTRETIFKFMDGAGEIYLAYDFRRLLVREYGLSGHPPVAAEVYDMGTAEDAFGILSLDSDGTPVAVGHEGLYGEGLLRFRKDRWFVRVLAETETPESKARVEDLANRIAAAIPAGPDRRPRLLELLPGAGLDKRETRYLHKQVALNAHYYIADENVLNMTAATEAALATYRDGADKTLLLLVRYPSAAEAARAFERFSKSFFYEKVDLAKGRHVERIEEGSFTAAVRRGAHLAIALEASTREKAEALTAAAETRIREARR